VEPIRERSPSAAYDGHIEALLYLRMLAMAYFVGGQLP
jgi:hypothetical protein